MEKKGVFDYLFEIFREEKERDDVVAVNGVGVRQRTLTERERVALGRWMEEESEGKELMSVEVLGAIRCWSNQRLVGEERGEMRVVGFGFEWMDGFEDLKLVLVH
ncbi:hypothetical protein ACH5RR_040132 [Cinchona calisaya]|uniref:Uncharacterized protein n=1 Tax=Cinchona calisaya TaxID=153742 RepID=A0ABD2XU42_9GENT